MDVYTQTTILPNVHLRFDKFDADCIISGKIITTYLLRYVNLIDLRIFDN